MTALPDIDPIRSRPSPTCCLCGQPGQPLYQGTKDWLYGIPGEWNFSSCPNPDCGLVWLDPMPLEEDIGKAYQTYFTHRQSMGARNRFVQFVKAGYLARRYGYRRSEIGKLQKACGLIAYLALFRRTGLDYLVAFLSALPRGRFLDLGCGDGQLVEFMQNQGWQAEGLDFDPAAIENAARRGLRVDVGTLQSKRYPDNSFEAIVMSHFVEHVHEPLQLLSECRRILKPGGRLLILTPNAGGWGRRKFAHCWRGLEPPRHLHLFSPQSLRRLLTMAGFKKMTVTTTMRNAGKILRLSRAIQNSSPRSSGTTILAGSATAAGILQLTEWFKWKCDPNLGEEIDLIAEK
jgi:SAM-dependent methyltransferase